MRSLATRVVAIAACLAASAAPAGADDGRLEVRKRVACTQGTTAELRLRGEKGTIRIELELRHRPRAGIWRVVVLHERRIAARATLTGTRAGEELQVRRTVPDWFGTDTIVARATGPRGEICLLAATL